MFLEVTWNNISLFYMWYILFFCVNLFILILLIFSINPILSILYLIIFFFINFFLLIFFFVEFIALIFLVLYAGAISVLFIFVLLLFDIKFLLLFDKKSLKPLTIYIISLIFYSLILLNFLNNSGLSFFFYQIRVIIIHYYHI